MRDRNTWRFVQKFSAIQMQKNGGILCLSGLVGFIHYLEELAGVGLSVTLMIFTSVF